MSAAVLLPLYEADGVWHLLLTKRSTEVEYHKGEISFPGGAEEVVDGDLRVTALREAHEEIGLAPDHVEVIGQLSDFVTRSNFRVRPYVGMITKTPYNFAFDEREVAEVLAVPVSHLFDLANALDEQRTVQEREVVMRSYRWREHLIYGATAIILRQFLALLEQDGSIEELTGIAEA